MMRLAGRSPAPIGAGPLGQFAIARNPARTAARNEVLSCDLRPGISVPVDESFCETGTALSRPAAGVGGDLAGAAVATTAPGAESDVVDAPCVAEGRISVWAPQATSSAT